MMDRVPGPGRAAPAARVHHQGVSEQQIPTRLVFRVPGIAILAALLFAICATPVAAASPYLLWIYLIPIALIAWVVRVRTVVDAEGLVAYTLTGRRRMPWPQLSGLRLTEKSGVTAVLDGGDEVALPQVRVRHLPALSFMSGGVVPDPTEATEDPVAVGDIEEATGEEPVDEAAPVVEAAPAAEDGDTAKGEPAAKPE